MACHFWIPFIRGISNIFSTHVENVLCSSEIVTQISKCVPCIIHYSKILKSCSIQSNKSLSVLRRPPFWFIWTIQEVLDTQVCNTSSGVSIVNILFAKGTISSQTVRAENKVKKLTHECETFLKSMELQFNFHWDSPWKATGQPNNYWRSIVRGRALLVQKNPLELLLWLYHIFIGSGTAFVFARNNHKMQLLKGCINYDIQFKNFLVFGALRYTSICYTHNIEAKNLLPQSEVLHRIGIIGGFRPINIFVLSPNAIHRVRQAYLHSEKISSLPSVSNLWYEIFLQSVSKEAKKRSEIFTERDSRWS